MASARKEYTLKTTVQISSHLILRKKASYWCNYLKFSVARLQKKPKEPPHVILVLDNSTSMAMASAENYSVVVLGPEVNTKTFTPEEEGMLYVQQNPYDYPKIAYCAITQQKDTRHAQIDEKSTQENNLHIVY